MKIALKDCPVELRERVDAEICKPHVADQYEIISVEHREGTPYFDKSIVLHTYEVILFYGNLFVIFTQTTGHMRALTDGCVSECSLIVATVQNIIKSAPDWTGLGMPGE